MSDVIEHPSICVVIPYYQRQVGVLERALQSISRQRGVKDVSVLIVDDSSPVPAESEVVRARASMPFPVKVIVQPNGGPGAARNRGLDELGPETRYIAFLDSDDEWSDDHLERAMVALSQGFDAYFSDLMQLGASVTAFQRAGRLDEGNFPVLLGANNLRAFERDMFDQIIRGNVIGTSTVVYDFQRFPEARFRVEFQNAGEDYLFWMDLAKAGARFAFSVNCEANYGTGVNVYSGSRWGTEGYFLRLHNEIKYHKTVRTRFELTSEQDGLERASISRLRTAIQCDLIHRLKRFHLPPAWLLTAHARLDPLTFVLLPKGLFQIFFQKARPHGQDHI